MASSAEGGTPGGPKKNSPQDYLFGRIIGEGETFLLHSVPTDGISV